IHKELQLFSDPHEYFTIGRPSVIEAEKEAAVLFEIGVPNGSPIGENSVSGILVLSCAACGTERDISLPWSFSFNVSESETKDKGLNWKAAYDGKGEPLTFRSISLEEAEESSFTADTKGQTSLVVAL